MSEHHSDVEKAQIFIVDDTLPNIDVLSKILESEDYSVMFAESGEEALEMIPEAIPDLILLDVMMPGIDGFETCKRLKENKKVCDIPVIFVTAKNDINDVLTALHVGGVDYITKPVQREEVLTRVNTHIQQQRLLKQVADAEKVSSLGSVIAAVAHEINTPIGNGMSAITELEEQTNKLLEHFNAGKLGKKELQSYLETTQQATKIICANLQRSAKLVKSFKNVSAKQVNEDLTTFEINSYINDVLLTIEPTVKQTKHKIVVESTEPVEITNYPGALSQVLINLVQNSIVHAYNDPEQAGTMTINVKNDNGNIIIIYSDDGQGIAQENIHKILDPFFTTKRNQGGTGLGLYVVHKVIVEVMQGQIDIASELGKGTSFTLTIPKQVKQHE